MRINYNASIRIWHWLNAIVVTGLLITFFLRETFFSWHENATIIVEKLASFGVEVTAEQAKIVAKAIRAPMWEWHIILGIALALLLLFRAWIFWQELGFGYDDKDESLHIHLVHWGYKLLYLLLIFMVLSGIAMQWHETFALSKDWTHRLKEFHELLAWFVVFFVPLHVAGVVVSEHIDQKGLNSRMISG